MSDGDEDSRTTRWSDVAGKLLERHPQPAWERLLVYLLLFGCYMGADKATLLRLLSALSVGL